jgi:predicted transcriptional regulator
MTFDNNVPVPPAKVKRQKPKSRPARWAEAVGNAISALEAIAAEVEKFEEAMAELTELKSEYEEWKDNLPESLQSSAVAEKLEAIADIDFEGQAEVITSAIDDVRSVLDDAEGMDLPQGFGRD